MVQEIVYKKPQPEREYSFTFCFLLFFFLENAMNGGEGRGKREGKWR